MRLVVVGAGPSGTSCIINVRDNLMTGVSDAWTRELLWETTEAPPELPVPRRQPGERVLDTGIRTMGTQWMIISRPPGAESPLHRTDTLDYGGIVSGRQDLILEDGEIELRPGDLYLIPGLTHGWRGGPDGCIFTLAMIGL